VEPVPRILVSADAEASLPRLGGMARADGVTIVSSRYWALARRDGTLVEGTMPAPRRLLGRIPVLRGLVRLALAFAPLMTGGERRGRRERSVLVAALAAPLPLALLPAGPQLLAGVVLSAALLLWLFRGRTLHLHGAEHRAIGASEERRLAAAWRGDARPSRISRRCGTNFAALALGTTVALYALVPGAQDAVWSFPLGIAVLGLTMELWLLIQAAPAAAATVVLAPGLALQRLTTREPSLEETRLALRAVVSVLERELVRG
jgi:uncharacterized protein YqhQ